MQRAGLKPETFATSSLELALSALALVAAVVKKISKTWIGLRNISHVLLDLRLIFVMFKDSSAFPMFTQLTFTFSIYLVHQ